MRTKYQVLLDELIAKIEGGELSAGEKFFSENEVAAQYQLSRVTVRKAYDELEKAGYIFREKGKGTFVRDNQIRNFIPRTADVRGYSAIIASQGFQANCTLIEKKIIEADTRIAQKLGVPEKSSVLYYSRIYTADSTPVIYAESYINLLELRDMECFDFNYISYSKVLNKYYHISEVNSNREMYAGTAMKSAAMLNTDYEAPVLIEHTTHSGKIQGEYRTLEYVESYINSTTGGFFYMM